MTHAPDSRSRIEHALGLHRQGKLKQAVAAYKSASKSDPKSFDAHYFCAMALVQQDKPAEAKRSLDRALKLRPGHPDALMAMGNVLMALGRKDQALRSYRDSCAADPGHGEAAYALGNALMDRGRMAEARAALERAVELMPERPETHLSLANTLTELGAGESALAVLDTASARGAASFDVLYLRANALKGLGRHEDAIANYRDVLAINPDFAEALNNLATSLGALGRHEEAVAQYRKALALKPDSIVVLNNLGVAYMKLGRPEDALAQYRAALSLDPQNPATNYNLGNALTETGDPDGAIISFRRALAADPGMAEAAKDLSHVLLAERQFEEGWALYQARFEAIDQLAHMQSILRFDMPAANMAEDIAGKRLLIRAEQGLGDEIMYASMMPEILDSAAQVTFAVEPRLVGLMQRSFPGCQIISYRGEEQHLYADFDVDRRFYLGSFARALRNKAADFPGTPYLIADPARRSAMRARLDALGPGRKIGIMWQGGVGRETEQARSVRLLDFAPILANDIDWISLSHVPEAGAVCAEAAATLGVRIQHWDDILRSDDYDDTAALLAELDAVVSVTCTVAHCAAALGVETHVLVNRAPIWRYGGKDQEMLWYRSMTLYRQTDDWPIEEIGRSLGLSRDPKAT